MINNLTVTRQVDELTNDVWTFCFFDDRLMLVLNGYSRVVRASTRAKKYVPVGPQYARISSDLRDIQRSLRMTEEEVPFPDDVKEEALKVLISQLRVGLWNKDYGSRH